MEQKGPSGVPNPKSEWPPGTGAPLPPLGAFVKWTNGSGEAASGRASLLALRPGNAPSDRVSKPYLLAG